MFLDGGKAGEDMFCPTRPPSKDEMCPVQVSIDRATISSTDESEMPHWRDRGSEIIVVVASAPVHVPSATITDTWVNSQTGDQVTSEVSGVSFRYSSLLVSVASLAKHHYTLKEMEIKD
ncbi:hypothetical protein PG994_013495 [Apiospora phragmitis]|uniref:Uncharacterized protein n=1 Tax=Apiospora phragmitis TaxID=2905665 RepID=A0ABR1T9B3_9PEZI